MAHVPLQRSISLILLALMLSVMALVAPAHAQVANGNGFASAVPCLSSAPAFATTSMANTLYPGAAVAPAADPALLQVTSASRTSLAPIGSVATFGENSDIANGLGSTYGLAYDDGSVSGIRRLFVAAYLKRSVSLSLVGLGAIWEYRFATGAWSLAAIVPNVGNDGRSTLDITDTGMIEQVGKVGLGDLEVSPDGRTLYAMNLNTRSIARYNISNSTLVALPDLTINLGVISSSTAVQADLRPFAIGFSPIYDPTGARRPTMVVGVIDTAERSSDTQGVTPDWIYPTAYVMAYNENIATGVGGWVISLAQSLRFAGFQHREDGTTYFPIPRNPAQTSTWNPWMPIAIARASVIKTQGVRFPEPLLTDIAYTQDGQTMYVGLRDRTGDQLFGKEPPANEESVLSQGDVLTYKLVGGNWTLQANTSSDTWTVNGWNVGDYFDDNTHLYPGSTPAHNDNLMGAVGVSLSGTGPSSLREQVMTTSLLGASSSGVRVYPATGGGIVAQQTVTSAANPGGGKAASLGDVEYLCSYALVGGRVWQDTNANGVQDAGEPAFPGIALDVFAQGGDASSPSLATLTTDASGNYLFAVPPNTAINIRIAASNRAIMVKQGWRITDPNQGGNDATDSDISAVDGYIEMAGQNYGTVGGGLTGMAVPMLPNRGDQRSLDIGLTQAAPVGQIGDRVWDDTNHNGIQDVGEPGHPGYAVSLIPDPKNLTLGLPPSYVTDSTTDANGNYRFTNLPPGRYAVRFAPPAVPFSATLRDVGATDVGDSDVDASTNYTSPFIAIASVPGNVNSTIDMGLFGGVPDVWVSKSGPAQTLVGNTFAYTLDYGNAGTLAADGVQLRDTLPAGLTYVSASPTPSSVGGQVLTWNLNTLAIGQTGRVTLTVRAPASLTPASAVQQSVVNVASISTTTFNSPPGLNDPPGNNSSSSSGSIVRPEVGITKTAPATALVGDEFSYTLSYANTGSIAAASVVIADTLPVGITFARFIQNPGAVCSYTAGTRLVSCVFPTLAANTSGTVVIGVKADVTTAASVTNMATIGTFTVGDTSAGNVSFASTVIQFPDPTVSVSITPSPFPVGTSGSITATATNQGTGVARSTTLSIPLPTGVALGMLPDDCSYIATTREIACDLGDLATNASGTRVIPISLPATFVADSFNVTASVATSTPERPATLADNSASASVSVVRPNVYVTATGPTSIVGQGSVFWYTVDYGNQYRANPSLTRAADDVVLTASLPADADFVQTDVPPSSISGPVLIWNLGQLAANASGQIHIVVQTKVPAGTTLHFAADISTTTPGDDLSDNHASVDTDVVQPPAEVGPSASTLKLAIHSDLDPNSQDSNPTNGVYVSDGAQIAWPAGEVLDFTPRLSGITFGGGSLPFPYEYRARVVGWSVAGFAVNGVVRDPQSADSRGLAGCRAGAHSTSGPQRLTGCAYAYLGGENRSAIENPMAINETQMTSQVHAYWTQPPPPPMRSDVYLYTLDPLRSVQIAVQVEVEVWIVNAFPGSIGGMTLPEIPVVPLPDPARQLITQDFDVTLLVPRSVVGPGSR
jgi:uncharacterized repeat protein (TIGR01451 family)